MRKRGLYIELFCWTLALFFLSLAQIDGVHIAICPLALSGITWCPGCGLGRAIICILHGEWMRSFHYHIFGFPALAILCYRIALLCRKIIKENVTHFSRNNLNS